MTPRHCPLFTLLVLTMFPISSGASSDHTLPQWLSGRWCLQDDRAQGEEQWTTAAGGLMLGLNRTVREGRRTEFEFLRIEMVEGRPTYLAQPGGRPPVSFTLNDSAEQWIRFENRAHDFPQVVEYRRDEQALRATIAGPGKDGTEKSFSFDYRACD